MAKQKANQTSNKAEEQSPLCSIEQGLHELFPQGHPDFIHRSLEKISLHSSKNADYAVGGDPLGNFKRVAEIKRLYPDFPDATSIGVAMNNMLKQLDAVMWNLAQGTVTSCESMADKLRDVSVYADLAAIMLAETEY